MAVAKKKISGGMQKKHGPKRNMFHNYAKGMRFQMAKAGMLNKYSDYESFVLAVASRGVKGDYSRLWTNFVGLPTIQAKKDYLKSLASK